MSKIPAFDFILFNGAPGTGKTTLCRALGDSFESPVIDFGKLREFHLDPQWLRMSDEEEAMTFEILQQMLGVYLKHGIKNILINDLKPWRTKALLKEFSHKKVILVSLVATSYDFLKERIETRNKGWKDVDGAWSINTELQKTPIESNEIRVEVSNCTLEDQVSALINQLLTLEKNFRL